MMERHGIEWEEKGTHNKHLYVLDYKKEQRMKEIETLEEQRAGLQEAVDNLRDDYYQRSEEVVQVENTLQSLRSKTVQIEAVESVDAKPIPLTDKVVISKQDYENLAMAAQKFVVQEKQERRLQRLLDAANQKVRELMKMVSGLKRQVSSLTKALDSERSFEKKFVIAQMKQENGRLKQENRRFRDILRRHGLLQRERDMER